MTQDISSSTDKLSRDCYTPQFKVNSNSPPSSPSEGQCTINRFNLDNERFALDNTASAADGPSNDKIEFLDELDMHLHGCLSADIYSMIDSIIYVITNIEESSKELRQSKMVDIGLITIASKNNKTAQITVAHQLFERLISSICTDRTPGININEKYLIKILKLCNVHMIQYQSSKILETMTVFYSFMNGINERSNIFNGDIILDSNKYIEEYDQIQNNLLFSGYLKQLAVTDADPFYIRRIPVDIFNEVFKYMSYGVCTDVFDRLCHLSTKYINSKMNSIIFNDRLPKWVAGCDANNSLQIQLKSIQTIRRLLSTGVDDLNFLIKEVIDSNVFDKLKLFLQLDITTSNVHEDIQFEACWALTNLCSGSSDNTSSVINSSSGSAADASILQLLINLLQSSSSKILQQTIWALGNIAGDCVSRRDSLLDHNVLNDILLICCSYKDYLIQKDDDNISGLSILRNVSWVLSNFCRGRPRIDEDYIILIQKCFNYLLNINDSEILSNFCWSSSYLTSDIDENDLFIKYMKSDKSIQKLVNLLDYSTDSIKWPALRSIGNIIANTELNTDYILNCGLLNKLHNILSSSSKISNVSGKREILWCISNITAGSSHQIQCVIDSELFPLLSNILFEDKYDIARESLWTIVNAVNGATEKQIKYLVSKCNILENVCAFLKKIIINNSNKLIEISIECIESVLNVDKNDEYVKHIKHNIDKEIFKEIQLKTGYSDQVYNKISNILAKL